MASETKKTPFTIIVFTLFLVIGCLIVWYALDVFLLAFAAILFAILLNAISRWISQVTKIPYRIGLTAVLLSLVLILTLIFWWTAPLIGDQLKVLIEQMPKAYAQLKEMASSYIDWQLISKEKLATEFLFNNEKILRQASTIFSFTLGTITSFIIFMFVGLYIAYSPYTYIRGFLLIFPLKKQHEVEVVLLNLGKSLRWWLMGKLISMSIVGVLTLVGLWILKIPLLFILSLLAGLLTFIPYVGPILAAIPALLVALSEEPIKALYVGLLYIIIHTIDGYFVSPYIDQKTVALPPALTIMVQVLLTILIGFIGLALASPLIVTALALFQAIRMKNRRTVPA